MGDGAAALAEWQMLAREDDASRAVAALVELAKHYEHRARDLPLALEAARRALLLAQSRPGPRSGEATPAALERRLWRLEARASGTWHRRKTGG
jgi:hypothetical protein